MKFKCKLNFCLIGFIQNQDLKRNIKGTLKGDFWPQKGVKYFSVIVGFDFLPTGFTQNQGFPKIALKGRFLTPKGLIDSSSAWQDFFHNLRELLFIEQDFIPFIR